MQTNKTNNMNTIYKKCKVVMIETTDKTNSAIMLGVTPNTCVKTVDVLNDTTDWMIHGRGKHLYVLSNDEIKEDDLFYNKRRNKILKCDWGFNSLYYGLINY